MTLIDPEPYRRRQEGTLPGWCGIELEVMERGLVRARLELRRELMAPNDYLHAGTIVTLADSCCGVGCLASLPEGAGGFTTLELKTNFLRGATVEDSLRCEARLTHGGRSTQLWDAQVIRERDTKPIALFRCTQFLLPTDDPRNEPVPGES